MPHPLRDIRHYRLTKGRKKVPCFADQIQGNPQLLHHVDPFAIRADPGGAVGDTPFIFGKTFRADFKAAGAAPAEWFFLFTAMTGIPLFSTTPAAATFS
jgi:hypothetical protein